MGVVPLVSQTIIERLMYLIRPDMLYIELLDKIRNLCVWKLITLICMRYTDVFEFVTIV